MSSDVVLLPDAGPLITLAYAGALDLLLKPGWSVEIVDMVLHEITRNETPTSRAIGEWVIDHSQREPVEVARRGRAVAYVVSGHDMREWVDVRKRREEAARWFAGYSQRRLPAKRRPAYPR